MGAGELLAALDSQEPPVRLRASKALRELSRASPEEVYPHFDAIAALLRHTNKVLVWNATFALAHLAPVDRDHKLDRILDAYLGLVADPVMVTAANAIKGAAMIAQARPDLAEQIAGKLLSVEKADYATPMCRNVAVGHALEALTAISGLLADHRKLRAFALRQVKNPRPATARKAAALLKR